MILSGEVYFNPEFLLPNGELHPSYFIILESADLSHDALCVMTTSRNWRDSNSSVGCNPDTNVFYIPQKWQSIFPLDSWIVMPLIYSISFKEILDYREKRHWKPVGKISKACLQEIIDCLKHYEEIIDSDYAKRLFN